MCACILTYMNTHAHINPIDMHSHMQVYIHSFNTHALLTNTHIHSRTLCPALSSFANRI